MTRSIAVSDVAYFGDEIRAVAEAVSERRLSRGSSVARFERAWEMYCGTNHALACSSGTAALHLALLAAGIGKGAVVAVSNLTYIATANAVRYTGAEVRLVDVRRDTWCMDVEQIPSDVTFVLPTHLYGVIDPNVHRIRQPWIGDACEAHGAYVPRPGGRRQSVGTLGLAQVFSFYANKILTTGEGGAVVTNDPDLAALARHLHSHSTADRYWHTSQGYNYRMGELAGAMGLEQAKTASRHLAERRKIERVYQARLQDQEGLRLQWRPEGSAPWVFPVAGLRDAQRTALQLGLKGIDTRPIFAPLSSQYFGPGAAGQIDPSFGSRDRESLSIFRGGLLLPLHANMTTDDAHRVCDALLEAR